MGGGGEKLSLRTLPIAVLGKLKAHGPSSERQVLDDVICLTAAVKRQRRYILEMERPLKKNVSCVLLTLHRTLPF